jgi:hypothetical protein
MSQGNGAEAFCLLPKARQYASTAVTAQHMTPNPTQSNPPLQNEKFSVADSERESLHPKLNIATKTQRLWGGARLHEP